MKPTKNHYYYIGCQHHKILFTSKKEALHFIKYNADEIEEQTGRRPVRPYYCSYCCGWHLTSRPNSYERKELIRRFGTEKGTEIYDIINPLITKGATIAGGILRKIKKLRHNLKYEIINCDKCRSLIDELFDIFETVIRAQLEDKATIHSLFSKFSHLCNIYTTKRHLVTTL